MNHNLTFEWNGKIVAIAQATSVMAYEMADGFFDDQFAGLPFREWHGRSFINLLDELLGAVKDSARREWRLEYRDQTGHALLIIRC